jgi:hypothetical protein
MRSVVLAANPMAACTRSPAMQHPNIAHHSTCVDVERATLQGTPSNRCPSDYPSRAARLTGPTYRWLRRGRSPDLRVRRHDCQHIVGGVHPADVVRGAQHAAALHAAHLSALDRQAAARSRASRRLQPEQCQHPITCPAVEKAPGVLVRGGGTCRMQAFTPGAPRSLARRAIGQTDTGQTDTGQAHSPPARLSSQASRRRHWSPL